jgi:inorganic triphosphatase YgiF
VRTGQAGSAAYEGESLATLIETIETAIHETSRGRRLAANAAQRREVAAAAEAAITTLRALQTARERGDVEAVTMLAIALGALLERLGLYGGLAHKAAEMDLSLDRVEPKPGVRGDTRWAQYDEAWRVLRKAGKSKGEADRLVAQQHNISPKTVQRLRLEATRGR